MNMKCPKCGYEWESKIPNPKECPRCKGRLDYTPGPVGAPKVWKKKEVGKEMTSRKLPLAAAAIIIVAAVGAWAILSVTSVSTTGTVTVTGGVVFGAQPGKSGIENIYIVNTGTSINQDLSGNANVIAVITSSGGSVTIPAGTAFDIVIAYKAHGDNLGYISLDNAKIEWKVSGAYTVAPGTEITDEAIFENTAPVGTPVKNTDNYMRVNARGATNWTLTAGQLISLDNVSLWIWG
jgi:hypothetical protein